VPQRLNQPNHRQDKQNENRTNEITRIGNHTPCRRETMNIIKTLLSVILVATLLGLGIRSCGTGQNGQSPGAQESRR